MRQEARVHITHHSSLWPLASSGGGDSASTGVIKGLNFARDDTGVTRSFINANDNVAFVAANDNAVVAVRAAA